MTLPLEGGAAQPLPGATFRSPSVSRDGRRIAYVGDRGAIRIRSLADGSDDVIATVNVPPTALTWIDDTKLALTGSGGRGETKRHEQTPEYSGSKIIYTVTERIPGPPADTYRAVDRRRRRSRDTAAAAGVAADAAGRGGWMPRVFSSTGRAPTTSAGASFFDRPRPASPGS